MAAVRHHANAKPEVQATKPTGSVSGTLPLCTWKIEDPYQHRLSSRERIVHLKISMIEASIEGGLYSFWCDYYLPARDALGARLFL